MAHAIGSWPARNIYTTMHPKKKKITPMYADLLLGLVRLTILTSRSSSLRAPSRAIPLSLISSQFPCAITSTYRPPFFFFAAAPFRGCAAPSKSSMLLALLMLVLGRDGGPEASGGRPSIGGFAGAPSASDPRPGVLERDEMPIGGGMEELLGVDVGGLRPAPPGGGGPPMGGPAVPLEAALAAAGGPPRGGGGVAEGLAVSVAPAFLFTHFLSSGS